MSRLVHFDGDDHDVTWLADAANPGDLQQSTVVCRIVDLNRDPKCPNHFLFWIWVSARRSCLVIVAFVSGSDCGSSRT